MKYQHINSKQVITIISEFHSKPCRETPYPMKHYKFTQDGRDGYGLIDSNTFWQLVNTGILVAQ